MQLIDQSNIKGLYLKFAILILATVIGELAIWWTMVRGESVDWISGQIVHSASHYAVSQADDGTTLVNNAIKGYEISLPAGFKVKLSKDPVFYYEKEGKIICEIKSSIVNYKKDVNVAALKKDDKGLENTYAGEIAALRKESINENGVYTYTLMIPNEWYVIEYSLSAGRANQDQCLGYFTKIKNSFIIY